MMVETRSSVGSKPKRALHQQYFPWPQRDQKPGLLPEKGLYEGEPEACRRSLRPFLRNVIYLALLMAVFKVYRIEERAFQGRAFQTLVALALAALPLHYMAPFRWKKPLFVAISILGLFSVCGVQVAAIVIGLATVLIGICFLPIAWIGKAVLMGGAAACAGRGAVGAVANHDSRQCIACCRLDVHVSYVSLSL